MGVPRHQDRPGVIKDCPVIFTVRPWLAFGQSHGGRGSTPYPGLEGLRVKYKLHFTRTPASPP